VRHAVDEEEGRAVEGEEGVSRRGGEENRDSDPSARMSRVV
jgi:hypothetical protein